MKKYHLLLPSVIALLSGCYSEVHYQEEAVESARKYIYENARELTPEQYAFVKLTPPVLFNGIVLPENAGRDSENPVAKSMRKQVCITWRIPEQKNDYMVFGITDGRMSSWSPSRLIRRPIGFIDENSLRALGAARGYAMASLYEQLSVSELNCIRFKRPELIFSAFDIGTPEAAPAAPQKVETKQENTAAAAEKEKQIPRPWKKRESPTAGVDGNVQLSLIWKLEADRYAVFCGVGQPDLKDWQIAMAGVFKEDEVKKSSLRVVKTSEEFLTSLKSEIEKKELPQDQADAKQTSSPEEAAGTVQAQDVKSAAKGEK